MRDLAYLRAVGRCVRRWRLAKHYTQQCLASLAKLSAATVRRVETGRTHSWATLGAIAHALGTTAEGITEEAEVFAREWPACAACRATEHRLPCTGCDDAAATIVGLQLSR